MRDRFYLDFYSQNLYLYHANAKQPRRFQKVMSNKDLSLRPPQAQYPKHLYKQLYTSKDLGEKNPGKVLSLNSKYGKTLVES